MNTYQPTEEQIEALALDDFIQWGNPETQWSLDVKGPWVREARAYIEYPAFQAIIRAAQAEAWDEGAKWGAVETGFMTEQQVAHAWLVPSDNPYREDTTA